MPKILKVAFPEKCIGCELCVHEVQRQLNKVGLDGSLIRVFKNSDEGGLFGQVTYEIHLDAEVQNLNIKNVINVCPTGVFTIIDSETENALLE